MPCVSGPREYREGTQSQRPGGRASLQVAHRAGRTRTRAARSVPSTLRQVDPSGASGGGGWGEAGPGVGQEVGGGVAPFNNY